MMSTLVLSTVLALGHHPGQVTRTLSPVHCHPITCAQRVTITRPWLDTDATVTVVMRHVRPVDTRNSLPAPWRPWRIVFGYITEGKTS